MTKEKKSCNESKEAAMSIDALEEQLNAELGTETENSDADFADEDFEDDVIQIEEDGDDGLDDTIQETSEEMLQEDSEVEQLSSDIDEVEAKLESKEVLDACKDVENQIAGMEFNASETQKGIEDEIGDEVSGGDPTVSELPKTEIDCDEYKDVFPTNSEYVARITNRLDRIANELEKRGMKKMAFRVDQLSDRIEASIRK